MLLGYCPVGPFFLFPQLTHPLLNVFVSFSHPIVKTTGKFQKTVTREQISQKDLGFRYQLEVQARWFSHAHKRSPTDTHVCTDHLSHWLTVIINLGHIWPRAAIKCCTRCDLTSWSMVAIAMVTISSYTAPYYHHHLRLLHIPTKMQFLRYYLGPQVCRLLDLTFVLHNRTNQ